MQVSNRMKIFFVASECMPIAKVGGLGDVIGSLPKALKDFGVDVRICLPKYQIIDFKKYKFEFAAKDIVIKDERVNIYQGCLPDSDVPIYLLENEKYFGEDGIYFEKSAFVNSFKEIQRFLFFSKAILEIFPAIGWFPDIIHCHDWHTAILPVLAKSRIQNSKFKIKNLLTIHNLANQGKWKAKEVLDFLGLKGGENKNADFNILEQGILNAGLINTVSPTYSREILTEDYGCGLQGALLKRKKDLSGILNGIDSERFNPESDPDIKTNYSLKNIERKTDNKIDLQKTLKLAQSPNIPLLGVINRLTDQKGVDLIIEIIPEMVRLNCQLVVLGVGMETLERKLLELSQKYPQNISAQIKFDPVLAQKIYAGADIFLMPSRFEPCGLGQMISQRYGTLPIVRQTGGLADTVEDKKTGFVFNEYNSQALLKCLKEALKFYQNKKKWQGLIKKSISKDFSWRKSAKEYLKLYRKLLFLK